MHKYQGVEFSRDGEEPVEALVTQFAPADLRADLDTEESRLSHAPTQLVHGQVGILQGDGAERGESGRVRAHDPREELV